MSERRWDFFISYAAADRAWACWIAEQLMAAGFSTVVQDQDFGPGRDFVHEMNEAVARSDRLVAVLSPAYARSPFAEAEWRPFFKRDPSGDRRLILGVRVAPGALRGLLDTRIAVDLVGLPPADACRRLLAAVHAPGARPSTPFPGEVRLGRPRSDYLEHEVRARAPTTLADRTSEWTDLHEFCASTAGVPYLWWQADAMAGKTALMATFALEHQLTDADVVAFFLRETPDDPRTAFVAAVRDQLAGLVSPGLMADGGQSWQIAGMLNRAAQEWWDTRQQRLVLVIDGLDEDRHVGTEESIAAALPTRPAAGMRVVVTARPHAPVLAGLPRDHPLRGPTVFRTLRPWEHATDFHEKAGAEIDRLAGGSDVERDVLGLVTASESGLGPAEIAELLNTMDAAARGVLTGAKGRTFRAVPRPGSDDAFDLGHLELRREAVAAVGPHKLTEYRGRLHAWAERYRAADWPATTPGYLLFGYVPMLAEVGDLPRLGSYACDGLRHRRQFATAGSDTATLNEIVAAQRLLGAAADDLPTLVRLAVHRADVTGRNAVVPAGLPAVWVGLGAPARAVALALGIPRPWPRATALLEVASALAANRPDAARTLLDDHAVVAIAEIPEPERADDAQGALVAVLTVLGDFDAAVSALDAMHNPQRRGAAARAPVQAMIDRGALVDAERLLPAVTDPVVWKSLAIELVRRAIADGERDIARRVTKSAADDTTRWRLVSECAQAVVLLGASAGNERADRLAEAKHILRFIRNPRRRYAARTELIPVVARVGGAREATALVKPIPLDRFERASAIAALLRTGAVPDGTEPARWVREQGTRAIEVIDRLTDPDHQVKAVRDVARALVVAGEPRWAAELTATIPDAAQCVRTRVDLVREATAEARTTLADDAERDLAAVPDPARQVALAAALIRECTEDRARIGRLADRAEAALLLLHGTEQRPAIVELSCALAAAGADERVAALVGAQRGAPRADVLAAVAGELAENGRLQAAAAAADALDDGARKASVCTALARGAIERGDLEQADKLAAMALRTARTRTGTAAVAASGDLAKALLVVGDPEHAACLARTVTDRQRRASLLRAAAAALAPTCTERAVALVDEIDVPYVRVRALVDLVSTGDPHRRRDLAEAAERSVADVDHDHQGAALAHLAVAVAPTAGRREWARLLAEAATLLPTLPERRTAGVIELAQAHVRTGDVGGALALVDLVERGDRCTVLTALVAAGAVTSSVVRRLLPTARRIRDAELRARALAAAARALAARGHPQDGPLLEAASATVGSIRDREQRARASAALAGTCAAVTGNLRRSMRLAGATTQPQLRASAQADVVRALAATGDLEQLRRRAVAIALPGQRATALAAVAEAVAADDLDAGMRLVTEIPPSGVQARSLAQLAVVAMAQDRSDDARRLVANALTGEHWTSALVALAQVEPKSLVALAEDWAELSADEPQPPS